MRGYDSSSYGDGMADVYDDWYPGDPATESCVAALRGLAAGGPVLELGAGTGRLAIALSDAGLETHALDGSAEMLRRLTAKPGGAAVQCHVADLAGPYPDRPFRLVFVAVNTFFGLLSEADQRRAMAAVSERLDPHGCFVIEAFVPEPAHNGDRVEVRDLGVDRVVLSISRTDASSQRASGQFVELRDGQPVRLRPWAIRWATPEQLDAMANDAGLVLDRRWGGWDGSAFGPDSPSHVSIYRRREPRTGPGTA